MAPLSSNSMNPKPYFINKPTNNIPESRTTQIFETSESQHFHHSLKIYSPTPLVNLEKLAEKIGVANIFIKDESHRFGLNAFKGLGASYAIHKLLQLDPSIETFCTATDGNHGRAVAWSSRLHNKNARVFVPRDTTLARIKAIENEGAVVEKINGNYEDTCAYARKKALENNWILVQDTAQEDYEEIPAHIMAGYLTHFKELEDSLHTLPAAKVDVVFLQSGVGSWPAAAAWYYLNRYGKDRPKLVVVEPMEAAGMLASLKQGKRTSPQGSFTTIMAGLNCGIPSSSAWEVLKNTIDVSIAIEDEFTEAAIRTLYYPAEGDSRVISGESGAGGFAGFLAVMEDERYAPVKEALNINRETNVLFYSTEGDTDPTTFQRIISGG